MSGVAFQVYAERVNVDLEDNSVIVTGVDLSDLVKQFNVRQVLECIDYSDIIEYVTDVRAEEIDE